MVELTLGGLYHADPTAPPPQDQAKRTSTATPSNSGTGPATQIVDEASSRWRHHGLGRAIHPREGHPPSFTIRGLTFKGISTDRAIDVQGGLPILSCSARITRWVRSSSTPPAARS